MFETVLETWLKISLNNFCGEIKKPYIILSCLNVRANDRKPSPQGLDPYGREGRMFVGASGGEWFQGNGVPRQNRTKAHISSQWQWQHASDLHRFKPYGVSVLKEEVDMGSHPY